MSNMNKIFLLFSIGCSLVACKNCDLTEVQQCAGSALDLVPRIYFNPVSGDLLGDILENYCGKGIEQCLHKDFGNCSRNALAPYKTVIDTLNLVCRTDISKNSCITRADVQHTCGFCFNMFKVVVDDVVGDSSLSTDEVNKGLCNAYSDVRSCCLDAALTTCNMRDQAYVTTLLSTTTRANRNALEC